MITLINYEKKMNVLNYNYKNPSLETMENGGSMPMDRNKII